MIKKIFYIMLFTLLVIIIYIGLTLFLLSRSIGTDSDIFISINKNSSAGLILKSLNSKQILRPSYLYLPIFKGYSFFTKKRAFAGTYKFTTENTGFDIINSIFSGKQLAFVKVTYPEGINLKQFASISQKKIGVDSALFIKIANSDSIRKEFGIKQKTVEGYFYPATYHFFWKTSASEIAGELLKNSNKHWEQKFAQRAADLHKSRHEVLTLASIIESETPAVSERKRIAGVYTNRLKRDMRLEADPTVQFAIGEKKKLSYKDLDYNSPYNTYMYKGLPPGPINSPSLSSIEAALEPEKNDFLYFVAIGDGSGKHNFARNFSQHKKFITEYRINRRNDEQK